MITNMNQGLARLIADYHSECQNQRNESCHDIVSCRAHVFKSEDRIEDLIQKSNEPHARMCLRHENISAEIASTAALK